MWEKAAQAEPGFKIYNYAVYSHFILGGQDINYGEGMPSMYFDTLGQERIIQVYNTNTSSGLQSAATTAMLPANQYRLVNLDAEQWDYEASNYSVVVPDLTNVLNTFRSYDSTSKTGFYAEVPQNTYNSSNPGSYNSTNAGYASLAAKVDYFAPGLYNYGGTNSSWLLQATYDIQQCEKYNSENGTSAPIYAYINPTITDTTGVTRNLSYSEMTYRLTELQELGAQGCVVWSSSGFVDSNSNPGTYGSQMGWQQAVTNFNKMGATATNITAGTTIIQDASTNGAVTFGAMNMQGGNLQFNPGTTAPASYFRNFVNDINATSNATVAADDGTVDLQGNISIGAAATLTLGTSGNSANILYVDGAISGPGGLVVQANGVSLDGYTTGNLGVITLSGANNYSGGTMLLSGTTVLGGGTGTLGSGTITLNGGNLSFNLGNIPTNLDAGYVVPTASVCANNIQVNSNAAISSNSGSTTLIGNISIAGNETLTLTSQGAGNPLNISATVSGANATLAFNSSSSAATVNFNSGSNVSIGSITIAAAGGDTTASFLAGSNLSVGSIVVRDSTFNQKVLNSYGSVTETGMLRVSHDSTLNINGGIWNQSGSVSLGESTTAATTSMNISGGEFVYSGSSPIGLNQVTESSANFAVVGGIFSTTQGFTCSANQAAYNTITLANGGTILLQANVLQFTTNSPTFLITTQGGTFNTSTYSTSISSGIGGSGTLTKLGAGALTLAGSDGYSGGINISAGKLVLGNTNAFPLGTNLTIANGATVDITRYNMAIANSSIGTISAEVTAAYNHGAWNGSSTTVGIITSSGAAADTTHLTAVGIAIGLTTFEGNTVPSTDVLVKYTYYGDANLDGRVDGSDYSRIDAAFLADKTNLTALTGWFNGDFNYDGVINGSDYTLIDNAFNMQGTQLNSEIAYPTSQIADSPTAVPEPAAIGLISVAALGIRSRRRGPAPVRA